MYDLIYRLKLKPQLATKTINQLTDTEANWWLPERRRVGRWIKQVKSIKRYKLPVIK